MGFSHAGASGKWFRYVIWDAKTSSQPRPSHGSQFLSGVGTPQSSNLSQTLSGYPESLWSNQTYVTLPQVNNRCPRKDSSWGQGFFFGFFFLFFFYCCLFASHLEGAGESERSPQSCLPGHPSLTSPASGPAAPRLQALCLSYTSVPWMKKNK